MIVALAGCSLAQPHNRADKLGDSKQYQLNDTNLYGLDGPSESVNSVMRKDEENEAPSRRNYWLTEALLDSKNKCVKLVEARRENAEEQAEKDVMGKFLSVVNSVGITDPPFFSAGLKPPTDRSTVTGPKKSSEEWLQEYLERLAKVTDELKDKPITKDAFRDIAVEIDILHTSCRVTSPH